MIKPTATVPIGLFLMMMPSAPLAARGLRMSVGERPDGLIAPLRSDIDVDADLGEWRWDANHQTVSVANALFEQNPPPICSDADCSARVQFAWDGGQVLYVAALVRDQSLVPLPDRTAMPWKCDSVMLSFWAYGAALGRAKLVKTSVWADHPFFGFSSYGDATGPRVWSPNSRYLAVRTADGYAIEAAVSLRDVGYDVIAGDRLKVSLILVDHDEDGKFAQLTQRSPVQSGTQRFAYWTELRLRDDRPYAGEMITSKEQFTSEQPVQFSGQIDAYTPGVQLTGIRAKDASGRVIAEVPSDAAIPMGKRVMFAGVLPDAPGEPGTYQLAAAVNHGVKTSNGAVRSEFEIVASAEADLGATGKLPDRYLVPDPKRFTFHSDRRKYQPRQITKDDYVKLVEKVMTRTYTYLYEQGRDARAGQHGVFIALPAYVMFRHTGDRGWLEMGLGLLRHTIEAFDNAGPAIHWRDQIHTVQLYLDEPAVAQPDKQWLADYASKMIQAVWSRDKPTEWGAMNRSLMWARLLDMAAQTLPDHADIERWKAYAEVNWQSWWPYRDHWENSSDYNAGSLTDFIRWAQERGKPLADDKGIHALLEREMLEVTPAGAFPGYGDANPWNLSCWRRILLFEMGAAITRDGRFKWAAHALFDYAVRQEEDLFSWHMIYDSAAQNCALAWLVADESIAVQRPDFRSQITHRAKIVPVAEQLEKKLLDEHGVTGTYWDMTNEKQFNKLILRTGADPFAPSAMIELCSDAGHHASTVPNLNYLMDDRSVMLCDLGYTERGPEYHNLVFIEDLSGIAPAARQEVVSVPALKQGPLGTWAAVRVENYKRWPVTNDRHVLLTSEGVTVVKDLVTFNEPFVARVRQQWQTRQIGPQTGDNWVNCYIPWIMNTGLGLGSGYQRWLNPAWDLLIYFTPQPGRDYEVFDRSRENIWQAIPLRVSQRYRGLPGQGEPIHFTTLLWPHKPELDAGKYAERVQVFADDRDKTCFRVDLNNRHALLLGLNGSGTVQTLGVVQTDAAAFIIACQQDEGQLVPKQLFTRQATVLELDGQRLHESAEKSDVDKNL